jgi:ferrous iron transport protein B
VMDGFLPVFLAMIEFLPTVVLLLTIVSLFEHGGWTLGFGCTTLAVSNCGNDRRLVRFLTFVPCVAKLPVLMFLCGIVLGFNMFGVVFLYVFAVFLGLVLSKNAPIRFPRFRKISVGELLKSVIKNILDFIHRISFGLIMAISALYTLQYFGILVPLSAVLTPLFAPIGLDNPAFVIAIIFGIVAKEMIIGVILSFGVASIGFTTASGLSFVIFTLLYTPCLPALTAIKSKLGLKFAVNCAIFNFCVAYACAFAVYMVLLLL